MMVLKGSKDWSAVPMDAFSPQVLPPPPDRRAVALLLSPPLPHCRRPWLVNDEWGLGRDRPKPCQLSSFSTTSIPTEDRPPLMTKNDTLLEQRHIVDEWIKKKLGAILVEINFWNWISVLLESLKVEDRFWNQAKNWLKSSHSMTQQFDINRLKSVAMWTEFSLEWAIIPLNTN